MGYSREYAEARERDLEGNNSSTLGSSKFSAWTGGLSFSR